MDRKARRFQERKEAKARKRQGGSSVHSLFNDAVMHHRSGRFQQAQELYRQILDSHPDHCDSLHMLGVLAYQQSQFESAHDYISRAIQHDNAKPLYHFNLGLVLEKLHKVEDSMTAYERAIELKPNYEEAYTNLGNVLRSAGNLPEAVEAYRQALRVKPDSSASYNNLGVVLREQGHREKAIEAYRNALRLNPNNTEAHCNLGTVLMEAGRYDEAIPSYRSAIELNRNYAKAHHHLGLALLAKGQYESALSSLRASADAVRNHGRSVILQTILPSRIKHDAEQWDHLRERGLRFPGLESYQQTLQSLRSRTAKTPFGNDPMSLTMEDSKSLAPSFSRVLHYAEASRLPDGALNPDLDVKALEKQYCESRPEILCVDELLKPEALLGLRKFCLDSTIWKKDYENGYIGAMFGEGFSCPLLLQVALELRQTFPGIFKDHQLLQAWAFKQDGQLKPLNIHADAAAVNVNFWITQDSANLDPTCGGLIVWDKEAPPEWDFSAYNSAKHKPKIMEFLKATDAKPLRFPYRENRALIFNSDLFHESDRCEFRDEYTSRRINITLLYGRRG